MVEQKQTISLDRHGVDEAAGFIEEWLNASKVKHTDVLRVRLTMESLLSTLITPEGEPGQAELRFSRWMGACWLRVRYGGERFDPAVTVLMDFICTGARVTTLHLEMLLQANRLDLLDRETLRKKM